MCVHAHASANELLGFSCLKLPPLCRCAGITDVPHNHLWLYVGPDAWDSGSHTCLAHASPTEPWPQPHLESSKKS